MNESCINFLGKDITTEDGKNLTIEVLEFMRDRLIGYQNDTGNLFNLEATPGEGTSYRLAKIDREKYPSIKAMGAKEPYYTNSTQLPVFHTRDVFRALEHQDPLQTRYTGGTVFHIFLGERLTSIEATKSLVRKVAERFHLPYYSITPTFSVCPVHGYIAGEHFDCPVCRDAKEEGLKKEIEKLEAQLA